MNLSEDISRIKTLMNINENMFLKRRVTKDELEHAFQEALEYATVMYKRKNRKAPITFDNFGESVISLTMDEIHPKLIEDTEDFPYRDIFIFLVDVFYDRILRHYESEFGEVVD